MTSRMKAAESRMSSSSLGERGCIDRPARQRCRLDEVRVGHCRSHDQIDPAAEKQLQSLLQSEVVIEQFRLRLRAEISDEIDVAVTRIEALAHCGAE